MEKDLEKQHVLVSFLLSSNELFSICHHILESWYFDDQYKNVIKFAKNFFEHYKNLPKESQVKAETGVSIQFEPVVDKSDIEYISEEIEKHCKLRAYQQALIKCMELSEQEKFAEGMELMKEAMNISLQRDIGLDYFDDPEERLKRTIENFNPISTGYSVIDENIGGGLCPEEITLFMGNSGVGKSIFLLNISANIVRSGKNVLYITLELSEPVVAKRLDSIITGVPQKLVFDNIPKVAHEVKSRQEDYGKLFIKRMPESTTNANHVRTYIKKFIQTFGIYPDVIVLDYLDIMATNHKIAVDNFFVKDKYMTEEARALGREFHAAILTASQMGRKTLESDINEIDQGHIQGGISKVNTADNLIAIIQDESMKAAGKYWIKFAKTRNSDGAGKAVELEWKPEILRIVADDDNSLVLVNKQRHKALVSEIPVPDVSLIRPKIEEENKEVVEVKVPTTTAKKVINKKHQPKKLDVLDLMTV